MDDERTIQEHGEGHPNQLDTHDINNNPQVTWGRTDYI